MELMSVSVDFLFLDFCFSFLKINETLFCREVAKFLIRKLEVGLTFLFLIITVATQWLIFAMFAQHHATVAVDDAV